LCVRDHGVVEHDTCAESSHVDIELYHDVDGWIGGLKPPYSRAVSPKSYISGHSSYVLVIGANKVSNMRSIKRFAEDRYLYTLRAAATQHQVITTDVSLANLDIKTKTISQSLMYSCFLGQIRSK
jgi:hypothetical protein